MAIRSRKPQEGGSPEKIIPTLGWLFLIAGILLRIWAYKIPWFGLYCLLFSNLSILLCVMCWIYWGVIHRKEIARLIADKENNNSGFKLNIVNSPVMKDFLFQAKAIAPDPYDPRYQQFPKVEQTKDGLRIEVIGNLRSWLLSDNFRDSLESFLNNQGYNVSIQNAQYHSNGWVYYTLIRGIKSDRLRF